MAGKDILQDAADLPAHGTGGCELARQILIIES